MVLYNSGFQFIVWSECATKSAGKKWVLCRSGNVRDANVQSQSEKHSNPAHSAHSKILAKLFNILIFEWRAGSSSLIVDGGKRVSRMDGPLVFGSHSRSMKGGKEEGFGLPVRSSKSRRW